MTIENRILSLYGALILSLVLMLVPHFIAALLSLVIFSAVLSVAYKWRATAEAHDLTADHTTFIIRTIWIGLLITFITTVAGGIYMLVTTDQGPLQSCAMQVADRLSGGGAPDMEAINALLQPCLAQFLQVNARVMMMALLIASVLPLIYFAMRIARGMSRAMKGHRIGNVKSWF